MSIAITIILFIVSLLIIVFLHELGHFITSKRAGIKIEEFGIGLPPRIFGVKRGETIYSINAIPLGAFVRSVGEDDPTTPLSLASKGPWTRLLVYAAGPLVNILLAFILLSSFFMLPTNVLAGDGVMVHSVIENSPAEQAGIGPADIILEVNGKPIYKWSDMQSMVNSGEEGEEVTLFLQESSKPVSLTPEFNTELQRQTIGVLLCWNIVNRVEQNSPAYEIGIEPGDTILSINKQPVYNSETMSAALVSLEEGDKTHLTLFRGQEDIALELGSARQLEGIVMHWVNNAHIEQKRLPVWKAVYLGGSYIINMPALIIDAIPLIKESPDKALVGPIGAGQLTLEFVECFGLSNMLFLAGLLSLGIALFNFIPIPPLDGGGMLIAFIEGIRRGRRLSPKAIHLAQTIGTVLIITLMIVITFSDILRLINGESFML